MKKTILFMSLCSMLISADLFAQKEKDKEEKEKGFKKENLFTGGSISLAFYNNTFLIGGSPVFGYSLTNWADVGVVVNYNYTSYRDYSYYGSNDKLRQTIYGGGAFARLFPVRFIFVQAQFEHNFIHQKYIPNIGFTQKYSTDVNSFLVGGGYTTGRYGKGGSPYFYLAVLFDVLKNRNSPYTDAYGRVIPIIRGGVQFPLFQGKNNYNNEERRGNGGKRPRNY